MYISYFWSRYTILLLLAYIVQYSTPFFTFNSPGEAMTWGHQVNFRFELLIPPRRRP